MCVAACNWFFGNIFHVIHTVSEISEQYTDLHEMEDANPYEDLWTFKNFPMSSFTSFHSRFKLIHHAFVFLISFQEINTAHSKLHNIIDINSRKEIVLNQAFSIVDFH